MKSSEPKVMCYYDIDLNICWVQSTMAIGLSWCQLRYRIYRQWKHLDCNLKPLVSWC